MFFLNVVKLNIDFKYLKIIKIHNLMQLAAMMNSVVKMEHAFQLASDAIAAMNAEIDQMRKIAVVDQENSFAQQGSASSNQEDAIDMLIVEMEVMKTIVNVSLSNFTSKLFFFGYKFYKKCAKIGFSKTKNIALDVSIDVYHFNYISNNKNHRFM